LLKKNPQTQNIPVIFLTVRSEVDDEVLGFNLGAVDYITKPMSPPIVRARVRTHIEIQQLRKRLEKLIADCQ
jgi:putative two-component system response regulator